MKTRLLTMALGGLLTFGGTLAALAQDTPPPPPSSSPSQDQNQAGPPTQGPSTRGMRMDPDRQLERLTRELNLTTDQQTQIKPLLVERQQKMQALMQDQSASEDRRTQARSIMQSTNDSIKAVLHDDQKQKFEAMQERMRRNRGMGAPDAAAPPPPPDGSAPQPQN